MFLQEGVDGGTGRDAGLATGPGRLEGGGGRGPAHPLRRPLDNGGFVNWSGGDLAIGGGGVFNNNGAVSLTGAPGATYTVDHPYGTSHFTVDDKGDLVGGRRAAQREETDGSFDGTLGSPIGPFLRSSSAPAGYLGNGISETTVTGGSVRNTVTVTGPGLPEAATSTDPDTGETIIVRPAGLTTDQFVVEGKVFDPTAPMPVTPIPVPLDSDGDGVIDTFDRCAFQVGPATNGGVVLSFALDGGNFIAGAGTITGWPADGGYYFNIHTADGGGAAGGLLRGDLQKQ